MDRIEWQTSCFFATAALHVVGRLHIAQPVSNSFLTEKKVDSMRPNLVGSCAVSFCVFSSFAWTHVVASCSTGHLLYTCFFFFVARSHLILKGRTGRYQVSDVLLQRCVSPSLMWRHSFARLRHSSCFECASWTLQTSRQLCETAL